MKLHADWVYVEQELGCSLRDRFLTPLRSFDNSKTVSPFLFERRGRRWLVCLHVEQGNVEAAMLPPAIEPVYYRPYFMFHEERRPGVVHPGLADALLQLADGERVLCLDKHLPVAVGQDLARVFDIVHETMPASGPVTVRTAKPADIVESFSKHRPDGARAARTLLERSHWRDQISAYFGASDELRFARLDALMMAQGLDVLVVGSTLNVQEIAGVPMRAKQRPLAALYRPGGPAWIVQMGIWPDGRRY